MVGRIARRPNPEAQVGYECNAFRGTEIMS
jgi:hypothetical protein